jgi:hypothetical protein
MAKAKKPKTKANKSAARKPVAKAKAAGRSKAAGRTKTVRKTSPSGGNGLAGFLRKLSSQPDTLERFSSSPAGREQVLADSALSAPHKELLAKGCVRDIIGALAGVPAATQNNTVIIATANANQLECGHAECTAFMTAVKSA